MKLTDRLKRVGNSTLDALRKPFTYLAVVGALSTVYGEPEKTNQNNEIKIVDGTLIDVSRRDTSAICRIDTSSSKDITAFMGNQEGSELERTRYWTVHTDVILEDRNGKKYSLEVYSPSPNSEGFSRFYQEGDSVRAEVQGNKILKVLGEYWKGK